MLFEDTNVINYINFFAMSDTGQSFYDDIVRETENTKYKLVLIRNTDDLYNILMDNWQKNIKLAASNGYSWAVLALFHVDAIYRGKIKIVDMLFPSNKFLQKCGKYNVIPIMDRIKQTADPFHIEYQIINELDDEDLHVAAITARWKSSRDDSDSSDDDGSSDDDENPS